jgi:amino acid transporter
VALARRTYHIRRPSDPRQGISWHRLVKTRRSIVKLQRFCNNPNLSTDLICTTAQSCSSAVAIKEAASEMDTAVVPATQASVSVAGRLKGNTLTLFDTTAVAVASVAPAYSLAATTALLVVAVGLAAPAAILVSFFPVLFIALAYYFMNRQEPNCGASYTWLSRTVSPFLGWFTGWVQTSASVLFCAAAPVLAATNTLALLTSLGWVGSSASSNAWLVAIVGLAWLVLVTAIVVRGIRLTANFQWVMVAIEYVLVLGFAVLAFIKIATLHPSGSQAVQAWWFNPFSLQGFSGLAAGAVLGVFFFWGWDTAANLNEESRDSNVAPGQAGVISMFVLLVVFLVGASAVQAMVPAATISKQGGNALFYFAGQVAPAPWSYLMVLAVLTSTVATTQTTLLPASRLTFSMARDHVFPALFAKVHPRFQTPWAGTLVIAGISAAGVLLTTASPSVNSFFQNAISNIGVLVAIYYGLAGLACAWAFRRVLRRSPAVLILAGVLPTIGGLFLLWIGYEVVALAGVKASAPVLITLGLGVPLLLLAWALNRTGYFRRSTVTYGGETDATAASPAAARE